MSASNRVIERDAARTAAMPDMKLEVVVIPVSDVDRAKRFYGSLGWRARRRLRRRRRPSASCSSPRRARRARSTSAWASQQPRRARRKGFFLVVSDIVATHAELAARGVAVSDVFHRGVGEAPRPGVDPERRSYMSYATFRDPDGNEWLLQEVTTRLPGRVEGETTFTSAAELAGALRRAEAAHGEHEKQLGRRDDAWADWYADFMVRQQAGQASA